MNKIVFIVVLFFLTSLSFAQEKKDKNQIFSSEAVYFQDFLSYESKREGMTRVDVYIQVPYKSIQFIKSPQGFTSKYSITASVYTPTKERLIVEKTWNETINVIDFNQTISSENYNVSMRSFDLVPGNYFIITTIEDLDSRKEFTSDNNFTVRDLSGKLSTSDVMFIVGQRNINGTDQVIPNITRKVINDQTGIQFYYEIYLNDSTDQSVTLQYTVMDKSNNIVQKFTKAHSVSVGRNQIIGSIQDVKIDLGTYVLNVVINDMEGNLILSTSKQFFSRMLGLPAVITDINKAVDQMIYIASPEELDKINAGETEEKKLKLFFEYWKSKDPSPSNDENEMFTEYYKRVKFTNENFSNYREGWKSDRGMVFIILGPPNNIDRHPFEYYSKPYEVWEYYNLNRSFVFIDDTGFGDYRLTTPLSGDLFRYRP